MSEVDDFVAGQIAVMEKQYTQATTRAHARRAEADELDKKAAEMLVILRHYRELAGQEVVDGAGNADRGPVVTEVVARVLTELSTFTSAELVAAVQAIVPDANKGTIQAELSKCVKKRGTVVRPVVGMNEYVSKLYRGPAPQMRVVNGGASAPPAQPSAGPSRGPLRSESEQVRYIGGVEDELDDPFVDDVIGEVSSGGV